MCDTMQNLPDTEKNDDEHRNWLENKNMKDHNSSQGK